MRKECAKQTLNQLYERIFQYRAPLAKEFSRVAVKGKLKINEWSHIMTNILSINLNWNVVVNYLAQVDSKGRINYTDFISRYSIPINEELAKRVVSLITDKIFESSLNLAKVFDSYDSNKDGTISYDEFMDALRKYDLGFSEEQLYDFMTSVDTNKDGVIDFNEFKNRFTFDLEVRYRGENKYNKIITNVGLKIKQSRISIPEMFKSYGDENGHISFPKFCNMIKGELDFTAKENDIKTIFNLISQKRNFITLQEFEESFQIIDNGDDKLWQASVIHNICDTIRKSRTKLKSFFQTLDTDKTGKIDEEEFKVGLDSINTILEQPLTEDQIKIIYTTVDKDKDGTIDFDEFLSTFSVKLTNSEGLQTIQ